METNTAIVLGVVMVLALLAGAMAFLRRRSADRLRARFGPEYERTVEAVGGRQKAQAELHQRQKRVRSFSIRSLTPDEREHYMPLWAEVQTQFVDDPKVAMIGADQLLAEIMSHLGYPEGDFEQRSADLSVDHPVVVQNYRTAHDIALRDANGEASTEDLRQAMLCYRALFRDLVGQPVVHEPIVVDEPIIDEAVEDSSPPADAATNDEPVPIETAPAAEVMIDEPAPAVQAVLGEKRANVPEPVST